MAVLAYLLPPASGLVAYLVTSSARVRWHGLQSIVLGVVWPAALYAGSLLSPAVTQAAAVAGLGTWLVFVVGTALGRDPSWPGMGPWLRRLAAAPPRGAL